MTQKDVSHYSLDCMMPTVYAVLYSCLYFGRYMQVRSQEGGSVGSTNP